MPGRLAAPAPRFNPRRPRGRRREFVDVLATTCSVSIHAAREGGDSDIHVLTSGFGSVSIHAAREGGDRTPACRTVGAGRFNPRRPRGRRRGEPLFYYEYRCVSIHAAREGGDRRKPEASTESPVSIHAAREGGDPEDRRTGVVDVDVSIHAAREGGDNAAGSPVARGGVSIHAAREGGDRALKPPFAG